MGINKKAARIITVLCAAGFDDEAKIAAMTVDDMLLIPGIRLEDIGLINELQKHIKASRVISFLVSTPYNPFAAARAAQDAPPEKDGYDERNE